LAQLCSEKPTVLVLDGLEPLQYGPHGNLPGGELKDQGVRGLLTGIANRPSEASLCLVSTRIEIRESHLQPPNCTQKNLDVLPLEAAVELLQARGLRGSDTTLRNAATHLNRHALALVLAAEYLQTFFAGEANRILDIHLLDERTKAGRHAKSIVAAYDIAIRRDGAFVDHELLNVLGLFDRPAMWPWLKALCSPPSIPGVTDHLIDATDQEIREALGRLRQWGMVTSAAANLDFADAHPLIREFFSDQLHAANIEGWRSAHRRLFEHLPTLVKPTPDSLSEMEPLMMAVAHGCKAGEYQRAFRDIYLVRIMRGDEAYAAHKLGALGTLLSVLSHFFEGGQWGSPTPMLEVSDRIHLLTDVGAYLASVRGYGATGIEDCYSAAVELCRQPGREFQLFVSSFGLWRFHLLRGQADQSDSLAAEMSAMAGRMADNRYGLAAERALATTMFYRGRFMDVASHAARGMEAMSDIQAAERARMGQLFVNEPGASCIGYWALAEWFLGSPDTALDYATRATHEAQLMDHPHTVAICILIEAMVHQFRRELDETARSSNELIALCAEQGYTLWEVSGWILNRWATAKSSKDERHVREIEHHIDAWLDTGTRLFAPYWVGLLADAYLTAGRAHECIVAANKALSLSRAHSEGWWDAEVYRLKGESMLATAAGAIEARNEFVRASDMARSQGARSLELRALTSLISLRGGHGLEATQFAELYSQFKEGLATPDLVDARRVLVEHGLRVGA